MDKVREERKHGDEINIKEVIVISSQGNQIRIQGSFEFIRRLGIENYTLKTRGCADL